MKLSSKNGRNMESLLPDRSSALQYISWHGIQAFCGSLLVNCYQLWRIPICAMGCVEPAPFSGGEVSFLQYFNLHRKSAKLRELAMSPRFSFWATRLLGVSKVRLVLRIFFSVWGLEVWWLKIVHNWRCPFSLKPKAFTKMPFLWSVLAACMQNEVGCDVYPSCNDLLQYLCFENLKNPRFTSYRCLQVIARHQIYRVHLCSKNQLNMWKMGPKQRQNDSETSQSNMGLQILAVLRWWGYRLALRFGSGTIRHK